MQFIVNRVKLEFGFEPFVLDQTEIVDFEFAGFFLENVDPVFSGQGFVFVLVNHTAGGVHVHVLDLTAHLPENGLNLVINLVCFRSFRKNNKKQQKCEDEEVTKRIHQEQGGALVRQCLLSDYDLNANEEKLNSIDCDCAHAKDQAALG